MTSKSNRSLIPWLIAIALLAMNIFQWYTNNQLSTKNDKQASEVAELEKVQTALNKDYEEAMANLEEMRGDNEELNELIETQQSELAKQKEKINGLIWTQRELKKAKEEIEIMNSSAAGYLAEIRQLKEANADLTESNKKLYGDNELLTNNLNQSMKDIERLDSTRTVLVTMKEELSEENNVLADKVDMAEAIKINSISVEGFKKKDDGELKSNKRAKNIQVLRSCLMTETNMVTPSGDETFFIRILNPQGETIAIENSGSGILTDKLKNEEIRYTTSGTVQYDQKDTKVCIDFTPNYTLSPGLYQIETYNKDYMVGKGSFILK